MNKQQISLRVANLDCEHEAAAIERGLRKEAGVLKVVVFPKAARVEIEFDPAVIDETVLKERLRELGFPPLKMREMPRAPSPWKNPRVVTSLLSGVLLLAGSS